METRIYVLTHKKFDIPQDVTYVPLQVGAKVKEKLNYLGDDTGDNISEQNCYYSELTGVYWVWKNVHDMDIVGVCHYRRFLLDEKELVLTKQEIEILMTNYDILTSKKLDLNFSYYYGFGENHDRDDLDKTIAVLEKLYPNFASLFKKRVNENHTYFGNIMICRKSLFDEYCEFLFPIFAELENLVDLEQYDDYHKRLFGFISEFLLMVWCEYKNLKVKECKVGIIGEKKETRETKEQIYNLIHQGHLQEAKKYFLEVREKRPDILMEASDITGELHLLLELISICEFEMSTYKKIKAPIELDYKAIISWLDNLNNCAMNANKPEGVSEIALEIAKKLMKAKLTKPRT